VVTEVITQIVEGELVEVVVTAVPSPTAAADLPDTLVICMGQEPETLYGLASGMAAASTVLDAVYDGPIDNRNFGYQAVILEKLPGIDDGDAWIEAVSVSEGDPVLDDGANPTLLTVGTLVRPAGCRSSDCAITFEGATVEMDQLSAQFTLLPGLKWSDGEPLTADDSVYAFELTTDPDTPTPRWLTDRTAKYEAIDDLNLLWTAVPGFLDSTYFTNFLSPLPRHAWSEYAAAELIEWEGSSIAPIGWGPYVIQEWLPADHIRLTRNPLYHRVDEGLPYFDTLVFRMVSNNSNANITSLLTGECDVLQTQLDDQMELVLELSSAGQLKAEPVLGTVFEHMDFNILPAETYEGFAATGAYAQIEFRQAMAMCTDRQAVVDTVMFGQSLVLDTYLPPSHPLFNGDVRSYPFDVAAGSALLESLGWVDIDGDPATPRTAQAIAGVPDGTVLEMNYWTTDGTQRQQATQILQQSMSECGIQVHLEYWQASEFFSNDDSPLWRRRYDLGQFAWLTGVEPPCGLFLTEAIPGEEFPYGWDGWNNTGYSNPVYDQICNDALQSIPGDPRYAELHLEAQLIFAEELPLLPLYLRVNISATRADMCGFFPDPTGGVTWNIAAFGYGAHCDGG
jgi:peptide/nickel transport system substrate-binding protein